MGVKVPDKPFKRFFNLLHLDRRDITYIILFAVFIGLINLSLPLGIQAIISLIMVGQVSSSWVILVGVVLIGIIASGFVQILQMSLTENIQQRIFARSALEFSFRIPRFKTESLLNEHPPELINRFFDTLTIQKGLPKILLDLTTALLQIFFGIVLLSFYHPVFVAFGFGLLLLLLLIFRFTGIQGLETSLKESHEKYKVAHWLEEVARVMDTFKLTGKTNLPWDKTDKLVGGYLRERKSHFRILVSQYGAMVAFKTLVTGGLLILGGILIFNRQINIGQFVAAEIVILLIINSVEKIILNIDTVYDLLTGLEKVGQVMDLPLEDTKGTTNISTLHTQPTSLRFEKVNFKGRLNEYILNDINIHIDSNEKIMLNGRNGSGKTVLLQMMAGLYEDYEGSIAYNDIPLRSIDRVELRSVIGDNLSQEDIFEGTILENLTVGRTGITVDEVNDVLTDLGLMDTLRRMEHGLETKLIPNGKRLSKSVVRRILIARSFLGNPKMILMDDPTSGLDRESQQAVINTLKKLKNTTVVIASADPIVQECATRIIKMEDGRIISA